MLSTSICIILIYLLYIGSYIPHIFLQAPMTKRLKTFSNNIIYKNGYGIIIIILSIVLFPHTYITVMAYLFFSSILVSFFGHIF